MDYDQNLDENYDVTRNTDSLDDQTQFYNEMEINTIISEGKRPRPENNEECWQIIERKRKRKEKHVDTGPVELPIQITVTSKEKIPKQFALAKLLKQNEMKDIDKIKYINPYKLMVTFSNQSSADKFICCPVFRELGWRIQKTWEVGISYGIIRDIELDLSEEELLENISSVNEVITAKRLNKKDRGEWVQSETFRIGFKGSSLPTHILLFELRIKVEPYTFPVTQCSKCWRFGHIAKMCPATKILCPKCCSDHDTCGTTKFKCANCSGNHEAMSKHCPVYLKEKRTRELMSEYNCTYQAALSKYSNSPLPLTQEVQRASSPIIECRSIQAIQKGKQNSVASLQEDNIETIHENNPSSFGKLKNKKRSNKKKKVPYQIATNVVVEIETSDSEKSAEGLPGQQSQSENTDQTHWKSWSFSEVIQKIKDFIKERKDTLVSRLKSVIKLCTDWFTSFFTNLMPDLSMIIKMFMGDNS